MPAGQPANSVSDKSLFRLDAAGMKALFAEWRETTIRPSHLDAFDLSVGGRADLNIIVAVPEVQRCGLAAFVPGRRDPEIRLMMGLSAEEAEERSRELSTTRAATGYHLWQ